LGADIRAQAQRFVEALDHLLDLLDAPEALRVGAERPGAAHASYGVHASPATTGPGPG
jgi:hypothetical protein